MPHYPTGLSAPDRDYLGLDENRDTLWSVVNRVAEAIDRATIQLERIANELTKGETK